MINGYDFCDCLVEGQTITKLLASNRSLNFFHKRTIFLNRFIDWGHLLIFLFHRNMVLPTFQRYNVRLIEQINAELKVQKVVIISAGYKEVILRFFSDLGMSNDNLIIIANTFQRPVRSVKGKTKHNFMDKFDINCFFTDSYEDISCSNKCQELVQVTDFVKDSRFAK
jgi:hypothetical protein